MILKHMLSLNLAKAFSTFKHLERTVLLDMLHQLLFIELFAACASKEGVWAWEVLHVHTFELQMTDILVISVFNKLFIAFFGVCHLHEFSDESLLTSMLERNFVQSHRLDMPVHGLEFSRITIIAFDVLQRNTIAAKVDFARIICAFQGLNGDAFADPARSYFLKQVLSWGDVLRVVFDLNCGGLEVVLDPFYFLLVNFKHFKL